MTARAAGGPVRLPIAAPLIRIAAMLVAFALGIYGFAAAYQLNYGHSGSLEANAFKSLQMVFGKFPDDLDDRPLPWMLHVARWALPLLTLWTTLALAWVQVRNPVRLRWHAGRGDHLVLAGTGRLAEAIADGEHEARRPVTLWADDPMTPWVARAADRAQPTVATGDAAATGSRLGLDRARAVLVAGDDDTRNIALASAALATVEGRRDKGDPLPVVARIDDIDLRTATEARYSGLSARGGARLRAVSLPDIAARELFLDRPLDRSIRAGSERTVFLLGFTPVIERYLLRMLAGAHFRDGRRPRFVVLAPDADRLEAVFRARRPGADALAPVAFVAARSDEAALIPQVLDAAIAAHGAPVAIVVGHAESARTLAAGYAIEALFRQRDLPSPPVHLSLDALPDDQLGAMLFPFGGADSFADIERLLQERHDALAQAVHEFYFEGRLTEGDVVGSRASMYEWDDLPESVRDDNRLVADCYQLKLRDIGARALTGSGAGLRLSDDEVEELARAEHDRWMAAKLIDGWVHGATRDDAARRHPDIVPYDDLSERIRELDREQIRLITRLLPASGSVARRVLTVGLVPVSAGHAGVDAAHALATLAGDYPDRVPLVIGSFEDAGTRAAMIALQRAGALVAPVLAGNADALIATLEAGDRESATRVLRAADTLYALDRGDPDFVRAHAQLLWRVAPDGSIALPAGRA